MSIDHASEARKCLSRASWMDGGGSDAQFLHPESAQTFALLANAHASLAHLPEQQVRAAEQLEAVLGVVVDHVMRMSTSWEAEARVLASTLMRDLDGVGVNIDSRIDERSERDGYGPRLCDMLGHRYDLTRQWIDRNGKCWEHTGDWSDVGGPVMRRDEPLGDSMVLGDLVREYGPLSQAVRAPIAPSRPVEAPF